MRDHLQRIACRLAKAGPDAFTSPDSLAAAVNNAWVSRTTREHLLSALPDYLEGRDSSAVDDWRTVISLASDEIALRNRIAAMSAVPRFFAWLNYLPVFDAFRWPMRELTGRVGAFVVVTAFLVYKFGNYIRFFGIPDDLRRTIREAAVSLPGFMSYLRDWMLKTAQHYPSDFARIREVYVSQHVNESSLDLLYGLQLSVWAMLTGILVGYLFAYMVRRGAKSAARGFMEVVYPFIIAAAPMAIDLTPVSSHKTSAWLAAKLGAFQYPTEFWFLAIVLALMTVGGAINLIGLLHLRRAFTIMAEARDLIKSGMFGVVRHPLYAGHFLLFFGSLLLRLHWYTIALYALFVAGQVYRARIEERKLASVFPEYAAYKASTGMFFPKLFRRRIS